MDSFFKVVVYLGEAVFTIYTCCDGVSLMLGDVMSNVFGYDVVAGRARLIVQFVAFFAMCLTIRRVVHGLQIVHCSAFSTNGEIVSASFTIRVFVVKVDGFILRDTFFAPSTGHEVIIVAI
jgi:hypothetical protein